MIGQIPLGVDEDILGVGITDQDIKNIYYLTATTVGTIMAGIALCCMH